MTEITLPDGENPSVDTPLYRHRFHLKRKVTRYEEVAVHVTTTMKSDAIPPMAWKSIWERLGDDEFWTYRDDEVSDQEQFHWHTGDARRCPYTADMFKKTKAHP